MSQVPQFVMPLVPQVLQVPPGHEHRKEWTLRPKGALQERVPQWMLFACSGNLVGFELAVMSGGFRPECQDVLYALLGTVSRHHVDTTRALLQRAGCALQGEPTRAADWCRGLACNALAWAAGLGDLVMVHMVLRLRIRPVADDSSIVVAADVAFHNWSPLVRAAHGGHVDIVRALLEGGVTPPATDSAQTGIRLALQTAVAAGHVAVIHFLLPLAGPVTRRAALQVALSADRRPRDHGSDMVRALLDWRGPQGPEDIVDPRPEGIEDDEFALRPDVFHFSIVAENRAVLKSLLWWTAPRTGAYLPGPSHHQLAVPWAPDQAAQAAWIRKQLVQRARWGVLRRTWVGAVVVVC